MGTPFDEAVESLTPIQREAVQWSDGAVLVLAGPGAGKTRVLTTRVARLLKESADKRFRILALTFTTKAANEMSERIESYLSPGVAEERTFIGTFHAFCALILRQHGSHIGLQPDFGICGQRSDQEALLAEAIEEAKAKGQDFSEQDVHWLDAIRQMKARLITPDKVGKRIQNPKMPLLYRLYEEKLRRIGSGGLSFTSSNASSRI
jgi:DNA helicase-2/ATP-dependent DNA helicase PcrA